MTIYDEMRDVASELFAEFPQGIVDYIKITPGTGPAHNPGPSVSTPYRINATAKGASFKYVSSGLAQKSDKQLSMPVDSRFTPKAQDAVEIDGVRYKVTGIDPLPAAGVPVAYVLILSRGG